MENLAELEVAFILSHAMSPVSYSLWSPSSRSAPPVSRRRRILVSAFQAENTIEVTVWHWQSLRDWDAAQEQISVRLGARLRRAGLARQVELGLPLHLQGADIEAIASSGVVDTMRAPAGETTVNLSDGEAILRWAEFPVFASFEQMAGSPQMAEGFGMGAVESAEKPFGFSVHPLFGQRAFDEAATSLRKALDRSVGRPSTVCRTSLL